MNKMKGGSCCRDVLNVLRCVTSTYISLYAKAVGFRYKECTNSHTTSAAAVGGGGSCGW